MINLINYFFENADFFFKFSELLALLFPKPHKSYPIIDINSAILAKYSKRLYPKNERVR